MLFSHRSLLYAVLIVPLASPAYADPIADARKAIQTAYDRMSAAVVNRDINGILAYYTTDYESIQRNGTQDGPAESRHQIQIMFNMMKSIKVSQAVQNVTLKGNTAQVLEKTHLEGITSDAQTKKPHKFIGDYVSDDIWVKGPKGWLMKRSKSLYEHATLDGKPQ
jgi:ketosteroid isomerase-like protein